MRIGNLELGETIVFLSSQYENGFHSTEGVNSNSFCNIIDPTFDFPFYDFCSDNCEIPVMMTDDCKLPVMIDNSSMDDTREIPLPSDLFTDSFTETSTDEKQLEEATNTESDFTVSPDSVSSLSPSLSSVPSPTFPSPSTVFFSPLAGASQAKDPPPIATPDMTQWPDERSDLSVHQKDAGCFEDSADILKSRKQNMWKQRRLYRMLVVKKKRALGLINIANSRVVRYRQKQVTAMQKARSNGKFVVSYFICSFCSIRLMFFSKQLSFLPSRACARFLRCYTTRPGNPVVYMDFTAGGKDMGRIVFEVPSHFSS